MQASLQRPLSQNFFRTVSFPTTLSCTNADPASAASTAYSTDTCRTNGTDFSSLAALFDVFRVRAMRVTVIPNVQLSLGGNTSLEGGFFALCDYVGGTSPGSYLQMLNHPRLTLFQLNAVKPVTFHSDWRNAPNARIFSPTATAIPAVNLYSIYLNGPTTLKNTGSAVAQLADIIVEWDVEFASSA